MDNIKISNQSFKSALRRGNSWGGPLKKMKPSKDPTSPRRRSRPNSSPRSTTAAAASSSSSSSSSFVDRPIFVSDDPAEQYNYNSNPRSFPHGVKQQCWDKAERVKSRDPDRWRRDPLGNLVFRKLVGCPGCLCHDYDHILPYSKVSSFSSILDFWLVGLCLLAIIVNGLSVFLYLVVEI